MEKPVVLVTGASGFLGSHCVRQLLETGDYQVRGTVRSLADDTKVLPIRELDQHGRLELVEADLTKAEDWESVIAGCTYVLHVASPVPPFGTADAQTVKTAIDGTLNVLRAIAGANSTVERVVLTSSISAVADIHLAVGDKVFSEVDWAEEAKQTDPYGKSKLLAERAAWKFVRENTGHQFELVVINPAFTIGPLLHKTEFATAQMVKGLLETRMPFTLNVTVPCCDVRDAAQAHVNALTAADAVNRRHLIVTQPSYHFSHMAADLYEEFAPQGYNVPTLLLPNCMAWVVSWFIGFIDKGAAEGMRHIGVFWRFDNTRMKEVLGIRNPVDQKQSAIEMAYTLIENGMVEKTPEYKPRKNGYKADQK